MNWKGLWDRFNWVVVWATYLLDGFIIFNFINSCLDRMSLLCSNVYQNRSNGVFLI